MTKLRLLALPLCTLFFAAPAQAQDDIQRSKKTYKKTTKKKIPAKPKVAEVDPGDEAEEAEAPEVIEEESEEETSEEEVITRRSEPEEEEEGEPEGEPEVDAEAEAEAEADADSDVDAPPAPPVASAKAEADLADMEAPRFLSYEPGDTIPPGYVKDRRMRTGLIIGGAVTLGVGWLAAAAAASAMMNQDEDFHRNSDAFDDFEDVPGEAVLYIPIAGPFIALDTVNPNGASMALLVANGVMQVGGLITLIVGLADRDEVLVRDDRQFAVAPYATPESAGLGFTGKF